MRSPAWLFLFVAAALVRPALRAAVVATPESVRSPENQVFQFMQRESFAYAADSTVDATAYLWIPEKCGRLRGLLIFGQNVTEHSLVGHPAIRGACAANDLGIVWSTPSFFSTKNKEPAKTVAFLQHLLDGLAASSGYTEVATVPWLPLGESGHLLMVDQLLDSAPSRCIAGIYVKNAHYFCQNRETPILVAVGTAQEWDQDKIDIRTRWNDLAFYRAIIMERAAHPRWPVSLLIDGGSGHFECPAAMARYFAAYRPAAVKARMPSDPAQGLLPIGDRAGFVAGFALPGESPRRPIALAQAALEGFGLGRKGRPDSVVHGYPPCMIHGPWDQLRAAAPLLGIRRPSDPPVPAPEAALPVCPYFGTLPISRHSASALSTWI